MKVAIMVMAITVALEIFGAPVVGAESAGVDLIVSSVVPSATEAPKVFVVVRNRGNRPLKRSFKVELWLDDTLLSRKLVKKDLSPNKPLHVVFMRPTDIPEGFHNFTAAIDPEDKIKEISEHNNTRGISFLAKEPKQQTLSGSKR